MCVRVRALICAVCVRKYRLSILPSRQNNVNQLIRNTITMTELKKNTFFFLYLFVSVANLANIPNISNEKETTSS